MSSFSCVVEEPTRAILRLLVLMRLLVNTRGISMEVMQEYLQQKRLRVSERQLQRDLRALTIPLGLTSNSTDGSNSHYWCSEKPGAWREIFEPTSRGTTDLGSDPLGLDTPGSRPIILEEPLPEPAVPCELGRIHQRVFRILCMVEMLPHERDDAGLNVTSIQRELEARGFRVTARTVARDLEIVREHFLVEVCSEGPGKQLWKRIESGFWTSSFEPRYPSLNLEKSDVVRSFLYRHPPLTRLLEYLASDILCRGHGDNGILINEEHRA